MTQVKDRNSVVLRPTVLDRLGVCFLLFFGGSCVVFAFMTMFGTAPGDGSPVPMLVFGAFVCYVAMRWWRGWYATIYLDWATHAVMIHRRPGFFGLPREVRFAPGELTLPHDFAQTIARGRRAKLARIELHDRRGQRVFKYTAAYDNRWRSRRNAELELLAEFFGQSS